MTVEELISLNGRLTVLLKSLEWSGSHDSGYACCPCCSGTRELEGHYADCELAAVLDLAAHVP